MSKPQKKAKPRPYEAVRHLRKVVGSVVDLANDYENLRRAYTELSERYLALGCEKERLHEALAVLVYLKDVLKDQDPAEYERKKPKAWENARRVLTELNQPAETEDAPSA